MFVLGLLLGLVAIPLMIVFPLGLFLLIRWSQCPMAITIESMGPIAAIGRSWRLTGRSWWHVFGVELTTWLVSTLLGGALGGALGALAGLLGFVSQSAVLAGIATAAASAIGGLVIVPFSTAVYVVLYYELRARTEGFDLAQRGRLVTETT